jgi:hypothetical protein
VLDPLYLLWKKGISGVMVSMFDSSVVDHMFIGGVSVSTFEHVSHYTIDEHMIYHT